MRVALLAALLAACTPADGTFAQAQVPEVAIAALPDGTPGYEPDDAGVMRMLSTRVMVRIEAGVAPLGCSPQDFHCYDNERPSRWATLDAFSIDRYEVTVEEYRRCVEAGECGAEMLDMHTELTSTNHGPGAGANTSTVQGTAYDEGCNYPHSDRTRHPMNCVSWHQAAAYCRWRSKRLPSEAEWERAARGPEWRVYPWGDDPPSCDVAVMDGYWDNRSGDGCGSGGTLPVGSRNAGDSADGVSDMVGNVWEWTADWYDADYYAYAPEENPRGPDSGRFRVAKGGGFRDSIRGDMNALRISNRYSYNPELRFVYIGFRCTAP